MATAGLFAALDFSDLREDEFHDWYDREHLPERQRLPGFLTCERWIGVTNPKYSVGTYDLESMDVLRTPAYRAISFENASAWSKRVTGACKRLLRVECDQTLPGSRIAPKEAGGLLLNAMNVAPEYEDEFNKWMDTEHIPALAKVPGTLCARRFRSREGSHRYVVDLSSRCAGGRGDAGMEAGGANKVDGEDAAADPRPLADRLPAVHAGVTGCTPTLASITEMSDRFRKTHVVPAKAHAHSRVPQWRLTKDAGFPPSRE